MNKISYKYFLLLFFFTAIILQTNLYSQVTQEWVARYDGFDHLDDFLHDMVIDTNGNVYVTGAITTNSQGRNFCTVKYNSSGIQQWVAVYDGPSNGWDEAYSVTVDKQGNVFVAGSSEGYGCAIKYNSSGVQQWVARYRYLTYGADFNVISVDSFGNVYAAGGSLSSRPWPGPSTGWDYLVVKYDSNGDSLWVRRYKGPGSGTPDNFINSMCLDNQSNVYVTGESPGLYSGRQLCTIKYNTNGAQQWVVRNDTVRSSGGRKIVVDKLTNDVYVSGYFGGGSFPQYFLTCKINSAGIEQWKRYYTGSNFGNGTDIKVDNIHNIYVVGKVLFTQPAEYDYLIIKYNLNGDTTWVRRYNDIDGSNTDPAIAIDKYSGIYITGLIWNGTQYQCLTAKYDSNGNQKWFMTYPGGGVKVAVNNNFDVYTAGGSTVAGTGMDYITIKYSQPNGITPVSSNVPTGFSLSQNYPNPFNPTTRIRISIPKNSYIQLKIYDVLGRIKEILVDKELIASEYEVTLDASSYSSGVYFYQLLADNQVIDTKKLTIIK